MTTLKIDLISDVVCPWCAIGHAHLEQALAMQATALEARVEWHPFVLNPDVAAEGTPMIAHLMHKYGRSEAEIEASQQAIVEAAHAAGLDFSGALKRRSWNTFDLHRVLLWARSGNRDDAFNRALFDAYFGRGENPTDPALLRSIAESLGLDPDRVDEILNSDAYATELQQALDRQHALGISGVPTFILAGRYRLTGAQPPEQLARALRACAEEAAVDG